MSFQCERNIRMGYEFRDGIKKLDQLKEENKKLKNSEKQVNESIQVVSDQLSEEGWETTSERSVRPPELDPKGGGVNVSTNPVQVAQTLENSKHSPTRLIIHSDKNGIAKIEIKSKTPDSDQNKNYGEQNREKNTREKEIHSSPPRQSSGGPFTAKRPKICKFYMQNRCKFDDRCFNIHPKNESHLRKNVPPWYNDMYVRKGYQPPRVQNFNRFNPVQTQNRFNQLPLVDLDCGGASGYWSLPHNPLFNANDFPPVEVHYRNGNGH